MIIVYYLGFKKDHVVLIVVPNKKNNDQSQKHIFQYKIILIKILNNKIILHIHIGIQLLHNRFFHNIDKDMLKLIMKFLNSYNLFIFHLLNSHKLHNKAQIYNIINNILHKSFENNINDSNQLRNNMSSHINHNNSKDYYFVYKCIKMISYSN